MSVNQHEVIKTFRDKETGQLILVGSFFGTDDKRRSKELFGRGFLKKEVTPIVKKEEITEPQKSGE